MDGSTSSPRAIKFRLWSGLKMMYDIDHVFSCLHAQAKFDAKATTGMRWDFVGKDGAAFLQFTGLKDRNGQEIYEGDIIESLWVVRWHDGHFVLDDRGSKEEFCAATVRNDVVLGNIYENPELLPPVSP